MGVRPDGRVHYSALTLLARDATAVPVRPDLGPVDDALGQHDDRGVHVPVVTRLRRPVHGVVPRRAHGLARRQHSRAMLPLLYGDDRGRQAPAPRRRHTGHPVRNLLPDRVRDRLLRHAHDPWAHLHRTERVVRVSARCAGADAVRVRVGRPGKRGHAVGHPGEFAPREHTAELPRVGARADHDHLVDRERSGQLPSLVLRRVLVLCQPVGGSVCWQVCTC